MKIHKLKTWPEYFDQVQKGIKTFEIRRDDRGFEIGDQLELMEYDQELNTFTGAVCKRRITCIIQGGQFGLNKGFVAMGIEPAL